MKVLNDNQVAQVSGGTDAGTDQQKFVPIVYAALGAFNGAIWMSNFIALRAITR